MCCAGAARDRGLLPLPVRGLRAVAAERTGRLTLSSQNMAVRFAAAATRCTRSVKAARSARASLALTPMRAAHARTAALSSQHV